MDYLSYLISNKIIFLKFMKEKYQVHLHSNIFFRDMLYAIKSFFEKKEHRIKYALAEKLALSFIAHLEKENELKKVSNNSWKVNFSL